MSSCTGRKIQVYGLSTYYQGPYRHYVPNALWIIINIFCMFLTMLHLRRLYAYFMHKQSEVALSVAGKVTIFCMFVWWCDGLIATNWDTKTKIICRSLKQSTSPCTSLMKVLPGWGCTSVYHCLTWCFGVLSSWRLFSSGVGLGRRLRNPYLMKCVYTLHSSTRS